MRTAVFIQVRLGSTRLPPRRCCRSPGAPSYRHVMRALRVVPADVHALVTDARAPKPCARKHRLKATRSSSAQGKTSCPLLRCGAHLRGRPRRSAQPATILYLARPRGKHLRDARRARSRPEPLPGQPVGHRCRGDRSEGAFRRRRGSGAAGGTGAHHDLALPAP